MKITISAPRFAALALFANMTDATRYYLDQVYFRKLPAEHCKHGVQAWFAGSPGAYVASATDGTTAMRARLWGLVRDEDFDRLPEVFGIKPERSLVSACKTKTAHSVTFEGADLTAEKSRVLWQVRTAQGKLLKQGVGETAEGTFPEIARVFPYAVERSEEGAFVAPAYMERAAKAAALLGASGVRIDGSAARKDPQFIIFGGEPDACGLIMPVDIGTPPREVNERLYRDKKRYRQEVAAWEKRVQAFNESKEARSVTAAYVPGWARV